MNIIIYLGILIISIFSIQLAKKYLGKLGLTITFIVMSTVSFLLAFKYITLSTININSNSITYVTMFTTLYMLLESTNKKEVKEIINLNFIINIFTAMMLYIMTYYTQSLTDTISINMKNVFSSNYQILIVYPLTTLLSNYLLIRVHEKIKKLYDNHFITTVTTYLLIGIIEGIIYTLLVYNQILNTKTIILVILSTYMVRLILTVIYSLFLTLLSKKKVKS
ncbi:MAG: VUT family protein [Bacilli bacterium]|nr:VUT family protein [Bacilli bacterium]